MTWMPLTSNWIYLTNDPYTKSIRDLFIAL